MLKKTTATRPAADIGSNVTYIISTEVQIVSYGKVRAKGIITVLGNEGGNSQKWGNLLIGPGKATYGARTQKAAHWEAEIAHVLRGL